MLVLKVNPQRISVSNRNFLHFVWLAVRANDVAPLIGADMAVQLVRSQLPTIMQQTNPVREKCCYRHQ